MVSQPKKCYEAGSGRKKQTINSLVKRRVKSWGAKCSSGETVERGKYDDDDGLCTDLTDRCQQISDFVWCQATDPKFVLCSSLIISRVKVDGPIVCTQTCST